MRVGSLGVLGRQNLVAGAQLVQLTLECDVVLTGDEIDRRAAGIDQGRDQQPVPERRAVFAIVEQVDVNRPGCGNRSP